MKVTSENVKIVHGDIEKIWDMLKGFAGYAFNKSHAIAYATISFYAARIWANHRDEYLSWLINNSSGDKKKNALETCKELGMRLSFPNYRNIRNCKNYIINGKEITVPIETSIDSDYLSDFIFGDYSHIDKNNLALMGCFDNITPDRYGLSSLICAIPSDKNYLPLFPKCDSLDEIITYGEMSDVWEIKENSNERIVLDIIKPRSKKTVIIYKTKRYLPDDRIEFNIKKDKKNFGIIKGGTLSPYTHIDYSLITNKFNRLKARIASAVKSNNGIWPYRQREKDFYKKEISDFLNEPIYTRATASLLEEEFLVCLEEIKHRPQYKYSIVAFEFDDGLYSFYVKSYNKNLMEKLGPMEKNKVYRIKLKPNWYLNKNNDPVFYEELVDIYY